MTKTKSMGKSSAGVSSSKSFAVASPSKKAPATPPKTTTKPLGKEDNNINNKGKDKAMEHISTKARDEFDDSDSDSDDDPTVHIPASIPAIAYARNLAETLGLDIGEGPHDSNKISKKVGHNVFFSHVFFFSQAHTRLTFPVDPTPTPALL